MNRNQPSIAQRSASILLARAKNQRSASILFTLSIEGLARAILKLQPSTPPEHSFA
jgi:hypothetical protein